MNAVYRATTLAVCLMLLACGNKGDLFLEKIELSEEQKAVLENRDVDKDVESVDETDVDTDIKKDDEKDDEKPKKKKVDPDQTAQ